MKLRYIALALVCVSWLCGQEAPLFPRPSYFKKMLSTPTGRVELQPPVRLADAVVDGKVTLSLRTYLELAMANNTDIAVQKLSVETWRYAVTAAFGKFDPTLLASFSKTAQAQPSTDQLAGAAISKTTSLPVSVTYNQLGSTGMQYSVGYLGSKATSNSSFSTWNPSMGSQLQFRMSQPLMRGRGSYITHLPITIARANLRLNQLGVENQILTLIQNAENAYWDVVGARETLKVNEEALALSDQSLKRSQRELELGALVPLDIYQPQADYASAQIAVTQQRFRLAQMEDALRKQIGADLDPKFRNVPIVLTEAITPPDSTTAYDREDLVQKALAKRQDLLSARVGLQADDLGITQATDQLRPNVSLTGSYLSSGRGGDAFARTGLLGADQNITMIPGGFWDALSGMWTFNTTTWMFGLNVTLPLRDRAGQAGMATALVKKKSDSLALRSLEQGVRLNVLTAISQVEASRESVKLAGVRRDLAQKQLDATKLEYDLGTTTMYFVLDAQTKLTTAESSVVNEMINSRRNELNLLRVTGQLLEERGIAVQ